MCFFFFFSSSDRNNKSVLLPCDIPVENWMLSFYSDLACSRSFRLLLSPKVWVYTENVLHWSGYFCLMRHRFPLNVFASTMFIILSYFNLVVQLVWNPPTHGIVFRFLIRGNVIRITFDNKWFSAFISSWLRCKYFGDSNVLRHQAPVIQFQRSVIRIFDSRWAIEWCKCEYSIFAKFITLSNQNHLDGPPFFFSFYLHWFFRFHSFMVIIIHLYTRHDL